MMTGIGQSEREIVFANRKDAGRRLAVLLAPLRNDRPVVLALPRGGVPVALEVARALGAPLDVIVVRKLGLPFQPELGFGAIGEGNVRLIDSDLVHRIGLTSWDIAQVEANERRELNRRLKRYRGNRPPIPIKGRTVVIVDDGLATGATARAAVTIARARGANRIIVAVPVAPSQTVKELQNDADQVVSLVTPPHFVAVGLWYRDFEQTSDAEVAALLRTSDGDTPDPDFERHVDREVIIPVGGVELQGILQVPGAAQGMVLFAHGSGSNRLSPRNLVVARALHERGLGSLLFDLLTPAEAAQRHNLFDVDLLGSRLLEASEWVRRQGDIGLLPRGYFGASTGAAAAIWAAGSPGNTVGAVVSRGGRPDLADAQLPLVRCPTLLIVGGADREVLELNRSAADHLHCQHQLAVVDGATHLFEETGAIEEAARLAGEWFEKFLPNKLSR
jgi:predicted phosphoribosyltransferase/predicted alpha/beta-hydrolase family hydrolase